MPTKPLEALLWRELSMADAKDEIQNSSGLLIELVNYSTNAFQRCQTTRGTKNEDLALLMLYLHIIEMTDGIQILCDNACAIPAVPLLRSTFEALLAIEYMLADDYSRRAQAWLVDVTRNELEAYERLDPTTSRGREYEQARAKDAALKRVSTKPKIEEAVRNRIEAYAAFLTREEFQLIEAENKRLRKLRRRRPQWYSLFDGPPDLRSLASRLNQEARYDLFYREWSSIGHANDMSRFMAQNSKGESAYSRLRNPKWIKQVSLQAARILLSATRRVLLHFRPEENQDFRRWYLSEIQERFTGRIDFTLFDDWPAGNQE